MFLKKSVQMNNTLTLKLDQEEVIIHKIDNDFYYLEDSTGIYKLTGNCNDYVDYMKNKGWEVLF